MNGAAWSASGMLMDHSQTAFVLGWGLFCLPKVMGVLSVKSHRKHAHSRPLEWFLLMETEGDAQTLWPVFTRMSLRPGPQDQKGAGVLSPVLGIN